jgi:hypothetical protein
MECSAGVQNLVIYLDVFDFEGPQNYSIILSKKLREWNKANGEDEKTLLARTAHFDQFFENDT